LATSNPFCFERAEVKISRKFATFPDIFAAKGKNLVTNATLLVAISSPVVVTNTVTNATVLVAISSPVVVTYLIHVLPRRSLILLVMFFYKFDFQSCPASQQRKTTTNSSAGEFLSFCELSINFVWKIAFVFVC